MSPYTQTVDSARAQLNILCNQSQRAKEGDEEKFLETKTWYLVGGDLGYGNACRFSQTKPRGETEQH